MILVSLYLVAIILMLSENKIISVYTFSIVKFVI